MAVAVVCSNGDLEFTVWLVTKQGAPRWHLPDMRRGVAPTPLQTLALRLAPLGHPPHLGYLRRAMSLKRGHVIAVGIFGALGPSLEMISRPLRMIIALPSQPFHWQSVKAPWNPGIDKHICRTALQTEKSRLRFSVTRSGIKVADFPAYYDRKHGSCAAMSITKAAVLVGSVICTEPQHVCIDDDYGQD